MARVQALALLVAAALLVAPATAALSSAKGPCPTFARSDIPASCKSSSVDVVCGACVDALLEVFNTKVSPTLPCNLDFGTCLTTNILPPFIAAGGNAFALRACNATEAAARLLPRVRCVGAKPSVADVLPEMTLPGQP